MSVLEFVDVYRQSIFPGDFVALRKVVYLLVLVQTLIQVVFAGAAAPEYIPIMTLGMNKAICLQYRPHQLSVSPEYFVQQLKV